MSTVVGSVKWFSSIKGYGFIKNPQGEVFVHYDDIKEEGYRTLRSRWIVEFEIDDTGKGLRARNVKIVSKKKGSKPD